MSAAPFDEYRDRVRPEWIDNNHHLNIGYYGVVFDFATDAFYDHVGMDSAYRVEHRMTTFTLESHTCFLREVGEADPLRFTTLLLGFDEKRIHYIHGMHHGEEGYLAATTELISLNVSLETRRSAPLPPLARGRLREVLELHEKIPRPPQVGRRVSLSKQG